MRRPLCLVCLAFVVTVMSILLIFPPPTEEYSSLEGRIYTLEGRVYRKELKEDICYVYLQQVQFCDKSNNSGFNSKSDNLHSKTNQNEPINIINQKYKIQGVICLVPEKSEPHIGSILQIRGKIAVYPGATNEGEFDQQKYWKIQKIDFQLRDAMILGSTKSFNYWNEYLYQCKNKCEKVYEVILEDSHASILKAMVLGNRKTLDQETKSLYQRNGIAHILAISGLHISLIGMGIYLILRRLYLPISCASFASIFIMFNYGIMTDMSSSACRAIVMFAIHLLAKTAKRSYDMLTAMTLSAVCIIVEQPEYVFYTGFQLSFGAIIAIGLVCPAFRHWCHSKVKCVSSLVTSFSISITTMPIILFSYYEIPTYAILLNLIIIPLMALLLLFGLAIIPIGSISAYYGKIVALPCIGILTLYNWLCHMAELLPGHSWIAGKPSVMQIIIFYIGLGVLVCCYEKISWQGAMLMLTVILSILTIKVNDDLTVTMIDVGQGDGFCIQNPTGNTYLIDSGSSSKDKVGTYQVIPFLKSRGIRELQYVFATHSDKDHINGIEEIIEQSGDGNGIRMNHLVLPGIGRSDQDNAYQDMIDTAKSKKITVIYMNAGDILTDGEVSFTCLHPQKGFVPDSANAYSNVLWLSYRKFDALFTGDVEENGEKALIEALKGNLFKNAEKKEKVHLEILKVAHHGSKNSTSDDLLTQSNPEIGLLSCGLHNSYGHPHKELLERLEQNHIPYVMTSREGAVQIRTDGRKIRITTFLGSREYWCMCR